MNAEGHQSFVVDGFDFSRSFMTNRILADTLSVPNAVKIGLKRKSESSQGKTCSKASKKVQPLTSLEIISNYKLDQKQIEALLKKDERAFFYYLRVMECVLLVRNCFSAEELSSYSSEGHVTTFTSILAKIPKKEFFVFVFTIQYKISKTIGLSVEVPDSIDSSRVQQLEREFSLHELMIEVIYLTLLLAGCHQVANWDRLTDSNQMLNMICGLEDVAAIGGKVPNSNSLAYKLKRTFEHYQKHGNQEWFKKYLKELPNGELTLVTASDAVNDIRTELLGADLRAHSENLTPISILTKAKLLQRRQDELSFKIQNSLRSSVVSEKDCSATLKKMFKTVQSFTENNKPLNSRQAGQKTEVKPKLKVTEDIIKQAYKSVLESKTDQEASAGLDDMSRKMLAAMSDNVAAAKQNHQDWVKYISKFLTQKFVKCKDNVDIETFTVMTYGIVNFALVKLMYNSIGPQAP